MKFPETDPNVFAACNAAADLQWQAVRVKLGAGLVTLMDTERNVEAAFMNGLSEQEQAAFKGLRVHPGYDSSAAKAKREAAEVDFQLSLRHKAGDIGGYILSSIRRSSVAVQPHVAGLTIRREANDGSGTHQVISGMSDGNMIHVVKSRLRVVSSDEFEPYLVSEKLTPGQEDVLYLRAAAAAMSTAVESYQMD